MAKFVIAGSADCPYFAKSELLGDTLAKNLPDFNLHKIVIKPNEWESWLQNFCNERGWSHNKSPVVWRELIDRGGKGLLIGGANEFQEYAQGYYGIKSSFKSSDMTTISKENLGTKDEIDKEEAEFRSKSKPVHVCISSGSGGVSYGMINAIARGDCLGSEMEISLRLLDTEANTDALAGVKMEAFDLACPLLRKIQTFSMAKEAFTDTSVIVILDEVVKEENEEQNAWLVRNRDHFVAYAELINEVAKPDVKVIVGGNGPVNFNVYMMLEKMPNISKRNVVAMSRMLENNAKAVLADRLMVNSAGVVDLVVWGNVHGSHVIDVTKARVHNYDGAIWGPPSFSVPAVEMTHDDKWLAGEYAGLVDKRQATVEEAMNHGASVSRAAAAATLLGHWCQGGPSDGQFFSLGVASEGDYDVPEGLVFSLPVTFDREEGWKVVKELQLSDEYKEKMQKIVKELQEELHAIYPPPKPPTPPSSPEPKPASPTADGDTGPEEGAEAEEKSGSEQASSDQDSSEEKTTEEGADGELDENHPSLAKIAEDREGEETEAVK